MNTKWNLLLALAFLLVLVDGKVTSVQAAGGYQVGYLLWQGTDFGSWTKTAVTTQPDGTLTLDYASAISGSDPAGAYYDRNFYNGGSYRVGEAISPVLSTFAFNQAIASWNAATPTGTWIETQMRARFGTRYSKWYNLGVWASGDATVQRHSVNLQSDADGTVNVDTLVLASTKVPVQVIWGVDDKIIPAAQAEGLPANVAVHRLPNVGHMPMMEAAAEVTRLISAHVVRNGG